MKRTWKWEKTITRAQVSRWWGGFLLTLAVVHLILTLIGAFQNRDIELNLLWVLGLTGAGSALRSHARADEHAARIADLEMRAQATYEQILIMEREARG